MEADTLDLGQRLRSSILQERHHGADAIEEKRVLLIEYGVGFPSDLLVGTQERWTQIRVVISVPSIDGLKEIRCLPTAVTWLMLELEL